MSDLISRKEVINLLHILHLDNMKYGAEDKTVINYVEELPTAYDPDEIVQRLEAETIKPKDVPADINEKTYDMLRSRNWGIYTAIEIVKSGGSV